MLTGIGVLLIGIACLVIAVFIAHVLNNLAGVLRGVEKTVNQLPDQMNSIFSETSGLIKESNHTLADINDKMKQLSPLFYIVSDVGNVTRKFSSSLVNVTDTLKTKTGDTKDVANKNNAGGLYGTFALGYYWLQKKRQQKKNQHEGAPVNGEDNK
ncbi:MULTISPECIES: DUF948 domain-containing protein [Virgibacillus]|uniref:DUF948 domain-containing protein n=2 Tax=Virgibacillus TaxID=84406 RepID=A0A024QGN4_9BACI|nr:MULTISPECIES: DUF948 domain-containing protein [Virgibacillus]EQB34529.1 hypothetical protein M948_20940 [Virgibacillus sp. CM-4]GGJ76809.1 hypothetical protein GCM10007111_43050 [Virgibacillus kapii]CDQ41355.1 putative protein containing a divergent version of the methyl-accepting chemotaxis-like domain protein [Virgibacillus massiliensis]